MMTMMMMISYRPPNQFSRLMGQKG